jgi:hypothetical protein
VQLVDFCLEQRADVFAYGILDVEAFCPAHKQALVDPNLVNRKAECET